MNRRLALIAAAVVVALVGVGLACRPGSDGGPSASPPATDGGDWQVAFHDDFSGPGLDRDRWTTCYWWDDGGCTNLGNDEAQWYGPDQVDVADGVLRLSATPAPSAHLDKTFTHASGMVTTGRIGDPGEDEPRFDFTYGYVEVRLRTPAGAGLWPAVWLLPSTNDSLPEIDVVEQYGDDTATLSTTLHTAGDGEPVVDRSYADVDDLANGWHTVAIDWRPGSLRWFVDGEEVYRVDGDRVPSEDMYLLINLAVGGPAGEPAPDLPDPSTLLVDEVTVWTHP